MRMTGIALSSVIVASVAFVTAPAPAAYAQVPVPPIAFNQPNSKPELAGTAQVSFVNPDGSGIQPRPLDNTLVDPQEPIWTKDGQRLAATATTVGGSAQKNVFGFNPDGTGIRAITNLTTPTIPCGSFTKPWVIAGKAYSRDGQKLVYSIYEVCRDAQLMQHSTWELVVNDVASGQQTAIIGGGHFDAYQGVGLDWSPNSDTVVVPLSTADPSNLAPVTALFSGPPTDNALGIDSHGSYKQITSPPGSLSYTSYDLEPAISPDGLHVAFVRFVTNVFTNASTASLMTVDISGANEKVLTVLNQEIVTHIGWSPDGAKLVFDRGTLGLIPNIGSRGLWVINANGSGLTQIVSTSAWSPSWASAPALERVAVLPALSNGAYGGYLTTAYIENLGQAPAVVRIEYSDGSGNRVGTGDVTTNLAPHAVWTVRQNNGHSFPPGGAGSAIISSSQPIAAFVNEFPSGTGDATSYTAIPVAGTGATLYAPAIANNAYGGYTTGIGLLNMGDTPTNVTITYRDANGSSVKVAGVAGLAAHGYIGLYSGDPALGLPSGFAGTATLTSEGQPLAAVVNEVGPGGQFSSYDAVAGGSGTLIAPTALNHAYGGYYTAVGVQDVGGAAGTVTISYYDQAGVKVKTVGPLPLAANGYLPIYQGDATVGPPPSNDGYTAVLSSTDPVAAIVNEVGPASGAAQQSTAYNTFARGTPSANLPLVESAGPDGWSTGLGIMNTGAMGATVTVTYFDTATGAPIGTPQSKVLPMGAFWGVYQPTGGLPTGSRASAIVTASGSTVAVICNEQNATSFMSYDGQ
jgi:hypothetical protein